MKKKNDHKKQCETSLTVQYLSGIHRSIGDTSEKVTASDGRSTIPANLTSPETESASEPTDQPPPKAIRPSGYRPPLDNMGVTKYQNTEMRNPQTCTTENRNLHMGGYDGGAEIGFNGEWNLAEFNKLKEILETAKTAAEEKKNEASYITLADRVRIMPRGSGRGVHYRYVIEGDGMKIYIHNNPQKNIQPLRIRYGFEALIGNSIFSVHDATLDWFARIGFHVSEEKISRLDLQIMTERPVREYIELILLGHAIQRARKDHIHRECGVKLTERANTRAVELGIVRAISPDDFDPHTVLDFYNCNRESIGNYWEKRENYKDLRTVY